MAMNLGGVEPGTRDRTSTPLRIARVLGVAAWILADARFYDRYDEAAIIAARARRAGSAAREILAHHRIDVDVRGPRPPAGAVLVANHTTYMDPLVLSALVDAASIAKAEVDRWPLVGACLRDLGAIFVRRGDAWSGARALLRAARVLSCGVSVVNFPEGTTTDGSRLAGFHRGIFGLAALADVPVIPARITYDDPSVAWFGDQTFTPHYLQLARRHRTAARVVFGPALAPVLPAEALAWKARTIIADQLTS
jgi:1-acyl-sn-glycerol-3-phosphate acyltransferase